VCCSVYCGTARLRRILRTPERTIEGQRMCGLLEIRRDRLARERLEVLHGGVAPPHRFPFLDQQESLHLAESVGIDQALDTIPRASHRSNRVDAGVVVSDEIVPQRSTG